MAKSRRVENLEDYSNHVAYLLTTGQSGDRVDEPKHRLEESATERTQEIPTIS